MPRDDVMKLTGREFDRAVAERGMGLHVVAHDWPCGHYPDGSGYEAAGSREQGERHSWFDTLDVVHLIGDEPWPPTRNLSGVLCPVPRYHDSAEADYAVLVHVRETWDAERQHRFGVALEDIWRDHAPGFRVWVPLAFEYRPGDYARAALLSLEPDHAA